MFRTLRAFLSAGRLPLRAEAFLAQNPAQYNVRRVRFLTPFFTRQRATKIVMYTTPVLIFWHYIIPTVLPEIEIDDDREMADADAGDEDADEEGKRSTDIVPDVADENATFIPLGWVRQVPPKPLKATDPEWLEYVKFSRDRQRMQKIRDDLARMVGQVLGSKPSFQRVCGTPLKVSKHWLDFMYPTSGPPGFERSGIEITDEYVAWVSRPVSSRNYFRLRSALKPTAIAESLWASYNVMLQTSKDRVKERLGLKKSESKEQQNQRLFDLPMLPTSKPKIQETRESVPGRLTSSDSATSSSRDTDAPSDQRQSISSLSSSAASQPSILSPAQLAFTQTLVRKWKPVSGYSSKGCLLISGLVEVVGPKAWVTIDVRATYNPKTSEWERVTMTARRRQDRFQRPIG